MAPNSIEMASDTVIVVGGAGDLGRNRILPALGLLGLRAVVVDPQPFPEGGVPAALASVVVETRSSVCCIRAGDAYMGVIVASPNNLHLDHCRWAVVKMGLPCLCEKPIAHTLADARGIVELASSGHVRLWIADHYLAKPPSLFALAQCPGLLDSIGPLRRARGRILESADTLAARGWLRSPERSGGGIWVDTGVHLVTVLLSLGRAQLELPWRVLSATSRGCDEDQGLAETYLRVSAAAAGQAEILLEVGKAGDQSAKDLLLEGADGNLLLDWQANTVTHNGTVVFAAGAQHLGGYLELVGSFAATCNQEATAVAPPNARALVTPELGQRALGFLKSAYPYADLPLEILAACMR